MRVIVLAMILVFAAGNAQACFGKHRLMHLQKKQQKAYVKVVKKENKHKT